MKLSNRSREILFPATCLVLFYSLPLFEFNGYSLGFYNSWLNQILVNSRNNVILLMWIWLIWRGIDDSKPFGWWMAFKWWMCSIFFLLLIGGVLFPDIPVHTTDEKVLYTQLLPNNNKLVGSEKGEPKYFCLYIQHGLPGAFAYREKVLWKSATLPTPQKLQALLEQEGVCR